MECFFPDQYSTSYDCEVRLEHGKIHVAYREGELQVVYAGIEEGHGHYEVVAPLVKGRGSLHRLSAKPDLLEGSWVEGRLRGMWQISLSDEE